MKTLVINLFKAQNTAPREAYRTASETVSACRMAGYVTAHDEYVVVITWPFIGPDEEKYEVLIENGIPKSCMKLRKA